MLMLTIYIVFSSGIVVSIHYCSKSHCCNETVSCCKEGSCHHENHSDVIEGIPAITSQQHCSETQLFLKILDNYEIGSKLSCECHTSFIREIYAKHPDDNELLSYFGAVIKRNDLLLSHPVIQGDSFLKFSQQFIDYA